MANEYGSGGGVSVQLAGPFANSGGNVIFTTVTLPAADWKNGESPYFQEVTVPYVSKGSMVNIHPSPEQLAAMNTIFLARNDNGAVTVYAIGNKPEKDYAFQASVTDGLNASVILGLPAGQNVSKFTAEQLGIDVGVKTVNGDAPDESGDIALDIPDPKSVGEWTGEKTMAETLAEIAEETVSGSVVRNGQTITITENLKGGGTFVIVIQLDEADFPVTITANGKSVPWTWSGF